MKTKILFSALVLTLILVMGCSETESPTQVTGNQILQYVYVGDSLTVDLLAGQFILVGEVVVGFTPTDLLIVTYRINDPAWKISQTHLWVGYDLDQMPQNKNGNPKIGQFPYSDTFDPPQTEVTYEVSGFSQGEAILIAAHAVIENWEGGTLEVYSEGLGGESYVAYSGPGLAPYTNPNYLTQIPRENTCVPCWQHPWWIANVNPSPIFSSTPATWIWEQNLIEGEHRSYDPVYGTVCDITEDFYINGTPISGVLSLTTDNGYEAFINNESVGSDGVSEGWRTSNLTEDFVTSSFFAWSTIEEIDVSDLLVEGDNVLKVECGNEYFCVNDWDIDKGPGVYQSYGTINNNPGGLIYKMLIDYETLISSQTGWGNGTQFTGPVWGTYIEWTIPIE